MTLVRLRPVEFRNLPLDLWAATRRWMDELLREFTVIASSESDTGVPGALLAFVDDVTSRFSHLTRDANLALEAAHAAGRSHMDHTIRLPSDAGEASLELWGHIVRAVEFCKEGDLLVTAPSERMIAFLRWYLHEAKRQLGGSDPSPWEDSDS